MKFSIPQLPFDYTIPLEELQPYLNEETLKRLLVVNGEVQVFCEPVLNIRIAEKQSDSDKKAQEI